MNISDNKRSGTTADPDLMDVSIPDHNLHPDPQDLLRSLPHHIMIRVEKLDTVDMGDRIEIRSNNMFVLQLIKALVTEHRDEEWSHIPADERIGCYERGQRRLASMVELRGHTLCLRDDWSWCNTERSGGVWLILVFKFIEQILGYEKVYGSDSNWHYRKTTP